MTIQKKNIDIKMTVTVVDGRCSCSYWDEVGLPCRHMFKILTDEGVKKIGVAKFWCNF